MIKERKEACSNECKNRRGTKSEDEEVHGLEKDQVLYPSQSPSGGACAHIGND